MCIAGLFTIESKLPITRIDIELFAKQSELFTNITGIWFGQSKLLVDKPQSGITTPLIRSFASEPNIFSSFHKFVLGQFASFDEPVIPSTKLIFTAITATIRKFFSHFHSFKTDCLIFYLHLFRHRHRHPIAQHRRATGMESFKSFISLNNASSVRIFLMNFHFIYCSPTSPRYSPTSPSYSPSSPSYR